MTDITYDTDACATPASLGYDVVHFYDGKAHRLGTYGSSRIAFGTRNEIEKEYIGSVEVISR
jgi:hypothetical protein